MAVKLIRSSSIEIELLLYETCKIYTELITNRNRRKSAPYLRLKNSKRRQSVRYSFAVPESVKYSFTVQKLGRIGPRRAKRGTLSDFLTSIVVKYQKGALWVKKFGLFSSLGRMIQFGTIKLRRTFKNYFDKFVWI